VTDPVHPEYPEPEPDPSLVAPIAGDSDEGREFEGVVADVDPADEYNR